MIRDRDAGDGHLLRSWYELKLIYKGASLIVVRLNSGSGSGSGSRFWFWFRTLLMLGSTLNCQTSKRHDVIVVAFLT
jgi:hypothetical protein